MDTKTPATKTGTQITYCATCRRDRMQTLYSGDPRGVRCCHWCAAWTNDKPWRPTWG